MAQAKFPQQSIGLSHLSNDVLNSASYHCFFCDKTMTNDKDKESHFASEKHKYHLEIDRRRNWRFRVPIGCEFVMCKKYYNITFYKFVSFTNK